MPNSHEGLVHLIEREGTNDERVLDAVRRIDRADFVPEGLEAEAYLDRPVALPDHQTTSQPSLIARMIEAAAIGPDDVVLEVGTGYGYQTALLGLLARRVYSIERHERLARAAEKNLERAGIENVSVFVGDGWKGLPDKAPFDAIVVSAAASEVPKALVDQLSDGGRLVIPVARRRSDDVLLFEKQGDQLREVRLVTPARFVPLVKGES
jgi:protein-L-isoaspartate(D-aspartate) O-methyltransferase